MLTQIQENHIRTIRRHLHQYPETSWEELETTKFIKSELQKIHGVEIIDIGLSVGVVAVIQGKNPGKGVALRADIDALNVVEAWDSDCKSLIPGKAHACGHDFHTASLFGAAMILAGTRENWDGQVVLIFQPAEETTNGAREIIKTGVLEKYNVKGIFGLHNRPEVSTGKVVVKSGPLMAAKINFKITVHGLGGHGSNPHKCIDPIVCASSIVQNVLTIVSRNTDPMKSLVLSICSIHGGTPQNLIVDKVEMTGSMRYLEPAVGERALKRLQDIIQFTAQTFECTADFSIDESVPSVINSSELFPLACMAAKQVMGDDCIVESESALASEDFADYMQIVPGFFYWLGSRKPDEPVFSWHHDHFHVDEDALKFGSELLARSAEFFLMNEKND